MSSYAPFTVHYQASGRLITSSIDLAKHVVDFPVEFTLV